MHTKIIADLFEATKDLENWAEFHKVANLGPALAFCVEYDIIESNEKVEEIIDLLMPCCLRLSESRGTLIVCRISSRLLTLSNYPPLVLNEV